MFWVCVRKNLSKYSMFSNTLTFPQSPSCSSGHCYYQTIVTPVSLPDSSCSRIPHTVTLLSIPASAEGNNGRRGRGFSVSIDQPLSPTGGYSPEHGPTIRVSQWVYPSKSVCLQILWIVIVWREEKLTKGEVSTFEDKGWKKLDSVIDEVHLNYTIEWKGKGNEQKVWVTVI